MEDSQENKLGKIANDNMELMLNEMLAKKEITLNGVLVFEKFYSSIEENIIKILDGKFCVGYHVKENEECEICQSFVNAWLNDFDFIKLK